MLYETNDYHGFTIELHTDETPPNPREDYDNFGTMLYVGWRYRLGDRRADPEEIRAIYEDPENIVLPVYAYIHSGTSVRTSPYGDPWDSGMAGIIYCTMEEAAAEWTKADPDELKTKAVALLKTEVETFNQYLTGDVYGYKVLDEEGDELDSCWGFFGLKYAREEAESAAKWEVKRYLEAAIESLTDDIQTYREGIDEAAAKIADWDLILQMHGWAPTPEDLSEEDRDGLKALIQEQINQAKADAQTWLENIDELQTELTQTRARLAEIVAETEAEAA